MSANQSWRVACLHEIKRRDRDIPVREHFGITAFGVRLDVGRDWGRTHGLAAAFARPRFA